MHGGRHRQPALGFVGGFYIFIGLMVGAAVSNPMAEVCFGFAALYFFGVLIKGFISLIRRLR